jgi:hypothetical protein
MHAFKSSGRRHKRARPAWHFTLTSPNHLTQDADRGPRLGAKPSRNPNYLQTNVQILRTGRSVRNVEAGNFRMATVYYSEAVLETSLCVQYIHEDFTKYNSSNIMSIIHLICPSKMNDLLLDTAGRYIAVPTRIYVLELYVGMRYIAPTSTSFRCQIPEFTTWPRLCACPRF